MSAHTLIPSDESLQGSWVELHFDSGSSHGQDGPQPGHIADLERLLLDAQHESSSPSRGSSHCDSPPRAHTPLLIFRGSSDGHSTTQSEEDFLEQRRELESLLKRKAEWISDWSSRLENVPPKEFVLKRPKRCRTLSMRRSSVMKRDGVFSPDILKILLPSLLVSHMVVFGIGICIGRRLAASCST
ncbi:BCL2 interacting protein 4 [Chanos chanos]|uniref:BCL2 interacting protein 4 n=1 Tax=Chanos chanos TaxID=29144 RepID=A0A6J2W8J1_CHACN|nr:BCL2/adenovirus E1B 19 kDa protein-interacting protein 3-like [Chanos chanos]